MMGVLIQFTVSLELAQAALLNSAAFLIVLHNTSPTIRFYF